MIRLLIVVFLLLQAAVAKQSFGTAASGSTGFSYTRATLLNQSFTWEFRLHNITIPGSRQPIFQTNGATFWFYVEPNGDLVATNWFDSSNNNASVVNISGRSDIIVRFVRDVSGGHYWLEIRNIDGSGYVQGREETMSGLGNGFSSGGGTATVSSIAIGGTATAGQLAWLRWHTGRPAAGQSYPRDTDDVSSGYLAAWEFENNGLDSSGHGGNLSVSGAAYPTTPKYAPSCLTVQPPALRAGTTATLDGTQALPLNDVNSLTYVWQQLSGPNTLSWSSHTTTAPLLSGLVSGTYTLSVQVTDTDGVPQPGAPCQFTLGAVATDSNGVVVIPYAPHSPLISNLTRMGVNPWPWYDLKQKQFSDWLIATMDTLHGTYWEVPEPETVQVTSTQIIGTGTHFQAKFCSGGTTPDVNANDSGAGYYQVVIFYPYLSGVGYDGLTGHTQVPIWRCTSDTVLEIGRTSGDSATRWQGNAVVPSSGSGWHYNKVDGTSYSRWAFGTRPINYYDNVLALYATYYRTGDTKYLNGARTLADRFWTEPNVDRGARYDGGGGTVFPNRSLSLSGLILRAMDNPPADMWPGLRRIRAYIASNTQNAPNGYDFREGGYAMKAIAEMGIVDSGSRSAAVAKALDMLTNKWTPQRQPNGSWNNFTGGWFHTALGGVNGVGTVTATAGQTAIVGSGANLNSGIGGSEACNIPGNYIVFYPTSATSYTDSTGANTGDQIGYKIASVTDDNHMTLNTPYTGTNGPKYWGCGSGAMGMGQQPYMLGISGQGMRRMAELLTVADPVAYASQIALYKSYAADIGAWVRTHRDADGGIWYFRTSPSCEGAEPNRKWCVWSGDNNDPQDPGDTHRINYAEAMYSNTLEYLQSPSAGLATTIDGIWSMIFGKPGTGGLSDDTRYMWALDNYMMTPTDPNTTDKWLGFFFGTGRLNEWAGERQGGLGSSQTRTPQVSVRFADHPLTVSARLTVQDPTGATTQYSCASSPCSISYDARTGGYLLKKELLDGSGSVVMSTDFEPLN